MICAQVKSSVFAALMTYFYFAALGLQVVGALNMDNVVMRKFRIIGLAAVTGLTFFMWWAAIAGDWCTLFYYKNTFSKPI